MKVFTYWQTLDLNASFHAEFTLIPCTAITSKEQPLFDEVVRAIKLTDCKWQMHEQPDQVLVESKT